MTRAGDGGASRSAAGTGGQVRPYDPAQPGGARAAEEASEWTVRRVFEALVDLSPLRVISSTGPSVFEAIIHFEGFGIAMGYVNAMTPEYHWHVELARCRFVRSRDAVHERSGRRVLFLELAEGKGAAPFVLLYLHRGKGEDFAPERLETFAQLHAELEAGRELLPEQTP